MDEKESVVNHTVSVPSDLNSWAKAEVQRRRETGRYSMGELLRDGLRALQARGGISDPLRCDFGGTPAAFEKSEVGFNKDAFTMVYPPIGAQEPTKEDYKAAIVEAIRDAAENTGSNLRTPEEEIAWIAKMAALEDGADCSVGSPAPYPLGTIPFSGSRHDPKIRQENAHKILSEGTTVAIQELEKFQREVKPTAAELAARLGIKTGATIEEVEPRVDQDSGFITSEQAALTEDELKIEESRQRFGVEATSRMLKMRPQMKRQGIKTWEQIFEVMQEQKERE